MRKLILISLVILGVAACQRSEPGKAVEKSAAEPAKPVSKAADPAGRFTVYQPPQGMGEQAGEPTLGYNVKSKRAMFIAGVETLRVTFPENLAEPLPESCDALWENKSAPNTKTISFDPILYTDRGTGRTFVSQLLIAAGESAFAYTDDDGDTWVPSPATLSGGIDHQSVGGGPYSTLPTPPPPLYPHSVYYCSQSLVESFCIRSDDGGLTFGPPAPLSGTTGCSALHGHVYVAPDGTAYVASPSCSGGHQGVIVSENDGVSWTPRNVTDSTTHGSNNPGLGIATDGTLYFCYTADDGHPHGTVSRDKGQTWTDDTDLGAALGIETVEFPVAIAGNPDRAACGFIGTKELGNSTSPDFPGVWYPYVAMTYDGGKSWSMSNVSPDDPVQGAGGLWEGGGSHLNRNLLDFNDMNLDGQGRVLFGYADGCIGGCQFDPSQNSYSSRSTIARQSGGKGLFAAKDVQETGKPAAGCLTPSSARDDKVAMLKWRAPDNGGAPITGYRIFRGAAPGQLKKIAETKTALAYADTGAAKAPGEEFYQITAVNKNGEGVASNLLQLPVGEIKTESACAAPGITLIKDPIGDSRSQLAQLDVQSVQIAEPSDMEGKLVVTLKIGSLSPAPPPSAIWETRFAINDTSSFFVGMETTRGTPRFVYGTIGITSLVVTTASAYKILGELPGSGFTPDGVITLVLDKSNLVKAGFDISPGRRLIVTAFARALTTDPANAAGTSFDPTGTAGYFLRQPDCSSLSAKAKDVAVAESSSLFGGTLTLSLLLPLGFFALRRRTR